MSVVVPVRVDMGIHVTVVMARSNMRQSMEKHISQKPSDSKGNQILRHSFPLLAGLHEECIEPIYHKNGDNGHKDCAYHSLGSLW